MTKPKLALIPAAQGDKFYSVLPSDGVGDFDFTRNSSATRIAPTGFIQEVGAFGSELVTNGNFDNDSDWIKVNATISNGVATFVSGTASLQQSISITVGGTYKMTYQINSGTGDLYLSSGGFTGATTSIPSTVGTHEVDVTAANTSELFFVSLGSSNLVIDNVSVKQIIGNKSRLNYDLLNGKVVNCPHYLLEPARTNSVLYSEDFSNAAWAGAAVTRELNQIISPDGSLNGVKISASAAFAQIQQTYTSINDADYTLSLFAKLPSSNVVGLRLASGSNDVRREFNLSTLSIQSMGGNNQELIDEGIENYGNGWYRIFLTCKADGTSAFLNIYPKNSSDTTLQSVFIFGAQLEQGSFPTSYIPTNGTAITRAAETADDSGDAATFNDSEGVLMAEFKGLSSSDTSNRRLGVIKDGTYEGIRLQMDNGTIGAILYDGTTNQYSVSQVVNTSIFHKAAFKYKTNDFSLYIDGFEFQPSLSGSTFAAGTLNDISFDYVGGNDFYGKTREVQYFDSVLTDAQLETLTSWTSLQEMITSQLYTNY